jgi:hypothetical protein
MYKIALISLLGVLTQASMVSMDNILGKEVKKTVRNKLVQTIDYAFDMKP